MRWVLIILALLIAAAVGVAGGLLLGSRHAEDAWIRDMNRLGQAMQRLDDDIKGHSTTPRNAAYFAKLSDLPLERFDDHSVTYYCGPVGRSSATIRFDESGVKRVDVH